MTAMLRERLTKALEAALAEAHDSSKEMIKDNIEAGLMHNEAPVAGTFDEKELTDMENLVNKGENANTNDHDEDEELSVTVIGSDPCDNCGDDIESIMRELVDISKPEDEEELEHDDKLREHMFGESAFAKMAWKILTESDYAGPLDFVPDTRLNVADVVNALKAKIKDGSEGIHVDLDYDDEGNKLYKVSQIDTNKLPKELEVVNVKLKLGKDGYQVEKTTEDFPVKKD